MKPPGFASVAAAATIAIHGDEAILLIWSTMPWARFGSRGRRRNRTLKNTRRSAAMMSITATQGLGYVGEDPAALRAEPADRLEVVFPVAAAADGDGERPARQDPARGAGLQEGPDRDVGGQPPGGRPDAYQVVVPFGHHAGDGDLRRAAAGRFRRGHIPTSSRNGCGMGNSWNLPA